MSLMCSSACRLLPGITIYLLFNAASKEVERWGVAAEPVDDKEDDLAMVVMQAGDRVVEGEESRNKHRNRPDSLKA